MLVWKHIWDQYAEMTSSMSGMQKDKVFESCKEMVTWGERNCYSLVNPDRAIVAIKKVFSTDKGPREFEIETELWPLQQKNRAVLPSLDRKIVDEYKRLKEAGVSKPSIVLFCSYFEHIHKPWVDQKYKDREDVWCGVMLAAHRLESTVRIAMRFNGFDLFGPCISHEKDGSILISYTKDVWRKELIERGVLIKKKGRSDANRRSENNRGSVRQMQNVVGGKKDKRKGRARADGGGGGEPVNRAVSYKGRRERDNKLQEDMSNLLFPPYKRNEKDG